MGQGQGDLISQAAAAIIALINRLSNIELYVVDKTIKLIRDGLDGKLIN